jgi:hypothetical protein
MLLQILLHVSPCATCNHLALARRTWRLATTARIRMHGTSLIPRVPPAGRPLSCSATRRTDRGSKARVLAIRAGGIGSGTDAPSRPCPARRSRACTDAPSRPCPAHTSKEPSEPRTQKMVHAPDGGAGNLPVVFRPSGRR